MSRPLDDLRPILRECRLQAAAEHRIYEFHGVVDGGRGVFTSLLAEADITDPETVRGVLDCIEIHAEALEEAAPKGRRHLMAAVTSALLLGIRLARKGLV